MDYCVLGASTFTSIYFIKDRILEGKKVLAISRSENKFCMKILLVKIIIALNKFLKLHLINDNLKIIKALKKYKPKCHWCYRSRNGC